MDVRKTSRAEPSTNADDSRRRPVGSPVSLDEWTEVTDTPDNRTDSEPAIPAALAARPWDPRRRVPIPPVSVHMDDRERIVDFTTINGPLAAALARDRRCSLCGETMGYWIAFLGGPAAYDARRYLDPPGHPECMHAAVQLCPFIAIRRYRRAPEHRQLVPTSDMEKYHFDQPESWLLGVTRQFRIEIREGVATYLPAPFKATHRYGYNESGKIIGRL